MTEIIPAILPEDYLDLSTSLARVRFLNPFVQIDICDGGYVPSVTWPYGDPDRFQAILTGEEGLPFWEDFQFEIDLMVKSPEDVIDDWIDAGASRIIVHNLSTERAGDIWGRFEYAGIEGGLALQIDEDISVLEAFVGRMSFVQCMGIAEIGVQGNMLDERVLQKIKDIRVRFPDLTIVVDGGVNLETASSLAEAGAHRLVSGSAILKAKDPKEMFLKIKQSANKN